MKITLDLPEDSGFMVVTLIRCDSTVTTFQLNGTQIKRGGILKIKDNGDIERLQKNANKLKQLCGSATGGKDDD